MRNIAVWLLAMLLVSFMVLPVAADFDFEKAIEEFSPSRLNTVQLAPGQTHTPGASVWAQGGGRCYSSDETVVTVDADGTVTAVGEGTAYVAITASVGDMYQLFRYDVSKNIAVQNGPGGFLQNNRADGFSGNGIFYILIPFIAVVLGVAVYSMVTMFHLSSTSMKTKMLPPRVITPNTVTAPMPDRVCCPQCGKPYGEGMFCATCGTSKKVQNVYRVPVGKRMTAQAFEKMVNAWLAENPYIYDCHLKLDTAQSLFIPFVRWKFFVKSAEITYSVAPTPQPHQYGFAFLYKFRLFGPIGYNSDKQEAAWLAYNPGTQVVSSRSGHIQHFGSNGEFYAQYYNYLFFKR